MIKSLDFTSRAGGSLWVPVGACVCWTRKASHQGYCRRPRMIFQCSRELWSRKVWNLLGERLSLHMETRDSWQRTASHNDGHPFRARRWTSLLPFPSITGTAAPVTLRLPLFQCTLLPCYCHRGTAIKGLGHASCPWGHKFPPRLFRLGTRS